MRCTRSLDWPALLCALLVAACRGDNATGPNLSGPPVPIALKFCAAIKPAWVGYQNGNGPWVTVSRDASAQYTYSFDINGAGALAYVIPVNGDGSNYGYSTEIIYASAEELQQLVVNACRSATAGTKVIRGALSGLNVNELGQVYLGGSSTGVVSANGTDASYTLRRVADLPLDLIAVRRTTLSNSGDIARVIVRRGINPSDGTTLASLDFNSAEALQPVSATVSVTGPALGGLMSLTSSYATAGGSAVLFTGLQTTNTAIPFTGVGASAVAGDLHVLALTTQDATTLSRAAETYFRIAGNRTLVMGPSVGTATVTAVTGVPNVRLRMDIPSASGYGTAAVAEFTAVGFGPLNRAVEVAVTAAYLGGVPATWSITMPDLTMAPGYSADFGMPTAVGLDYLSILTGGSRLFFAAPADGQTLSYGIREGTTITNAKLLATSTPLIAPAGAKTGSRAAAAAGRPWSTASP